MKWRSFYWTLFTERYILRKTYGVAAAPPSRVPADELIVDEKRLVAVVVVAAEVVTEAPNRPPVVEGAVEETAVA